MIVVYDCVIIRIHTVLILGELPIGSNLTKFIESTFIDKDIDINDLCPSRSCIGFIMDARRTQTFSSDICYETICCMLTHCKDDTIISYCLAYIGERLVVVVITIEVQRHIVGSNLNGNLVDLSML